MPVTAKWGNPEQTVIILGYEKPWDWSQFDAAVIQINTMLDTVTHPVDMIIAISDGLPRDISPQRFRKAMQNFHRNIHSTALVVPSDLLRWTITAFIRVTGQDHRNFFFAASIPEAIRKFNQPTPEKAVVPDNAEKRVS